MCRWTSVSGHLHSTSPVDVVVEERTGACRVVSFFSSRHNRRVKGAELVPQLRLERPAAPVRAEVLAAPGQQRRFPEQPVQHRVQLPGLGRLGDAEGHRDFVLGIHVQPEPRLHLRPEIAGLPVHAGGLVLPPAGVRVGSLAGLAADLPRRVAVHRLAVRGAPRSPATPPSVAPATPGPGRRGSLLSSLALRSREKLWLPVWLCRDMHRFPGDFNQII